MAFPNFFPADDAPEVKPASNYFPTEAQLSETGVMSSAVFREVAERYATRTGKSYEEAYAEVLNKGPENIFLMDYTPAPADIVNKGFENNFGFEALVNEAGKYVENNKTVLESKDSADLARDLTEEDLFQDPLWRMTVVMDRVRKGFANAFPKESMYGSATSFIGAITSEMTVGAVNDLLNTVGLDVGREARGREAYKMLSEAKSLEEVDKIVNDLIVYSKQYGYTGEGNPILMTQELISILSGGESEYPVFNTAINVLTGEALWKGAGLVKKAVTAKKAATAIDHVDLAAAVKGTDGGNRAASVAFDTPETTARVSDHIENDINRIIKTSPDSAIDVTAKPAETFEMQNKIRSALTSKPSFINDISARYAGDDVAAAEEITKAVKEKLASYEKITDLRVANVSAETIERIEPIRTVKTVQAPAVAPVRKKPKKIGEAAYANEALYDKAINYIIDLPGDSKLSMTALSKHLGLKSREEVFPFINRMRSEKILSTGGVRLVESFKDALKLKKPREVAEEGMEEATISKEVTIEEPVKVDTGSNPYFEIEEGILNNRYVTAAFVKSDGTLFKNREDAEKVVKTFGEGNVVETNNGFYIKYTSALPMIESARATKVGSGIKEFYTNQDAIRSFTGIPAFDNFVFSGKHTTSKFLQSVYITGQKKSAGILAEYQNKLNKSFLKLPSEDREGIDKVLTYLRDVDSFGRDTYYDETEFALKFYELTKGRSVTPKILEGYEDIVKFLNTVNIIQADRPLKEINRLGGFHARLRDGKNYILFRTNAKPSVVYDADAKKAIKSDAINNRPVYEVFDEAGYFTPDGYSKYIVGSIEESRPVEHTDVYGFTPGGSKIVEDYNYLLIQRKPIKDISGEVREGRPITAVLGKTEDELKKVFKEVETLKAAYLDRTIDDAEFEELVKKNNGFDPAYVSAGQNKSGKQAFKEWMDRHGLAMEVPLEIVRKKMPLDKKSIEGDYSYEDALFKNMNPPSGNRNRISYGYGNGSLFKNSSVLETLPRHWGSSNYYLGRRNYEKLAVEGFLKGAEEAGVVISTPVSKKMSLMDRLVNTKIDTSTSAGRKFAVEQALIKDRLAVDREPSIKIFNALLNKAGHFMIDLTVNGKTPAFVKNNKILKSMIDYSVRDINSKDPVAAIRGMTFHPTFGFLDPNSFVMQTTGVLNAMTRTNPVEAARAAALYKVVRFALINPTEANLKELYKRSFAAKIVSNEKELNDIVRYMRNSGFLQIHDNVALGSHASVNISKAGNYLETAKNISAFLFREANVMNHIVSANIAYREFMAIPKNAKLDITKGVGKTEFERFMAYRIEDLSGSMSLASAAGWQKGIASLALQYMSQPIRIMEDMFIGRLNPGERIYFNAQQLALFGASGTLPTAVGFAMYSRSSAEKEQEALDRDLYTLARWGSLDYVLSNLIGEYTSMTDRLAASIAILDIFSNVTEGKFTEVLGGPSVGTYKRWFDAGSNLFESSYNSLYILANTGRLETELVSSDFMNALRQIRAADTVTRAYYLYRFNEYTQKNGDKFPIKYPSSTAIAGFLGIPLQDVTLNYEIYDLNQKASKYLRDIEKEVLRLHKASVEARGEEFTNLRKQIEVLLLPLDPKDKKRIIRSLREDQSTERMVDFNLRVMGDESAKQLNSAFENLKDIE